MRVFWAVVCLVALSFVGGCSPMGGDDYEAAHFTINGDRAVMRGVIDDTTYEAIIEMMDENNKVRTLVLERVERATSYRVLRETSRLLSDYGLATHVPAGGYLGPEGVDFFLGGRKRTVDPDAVLQVAGWDDGEFAGRDLPKHHSLHFAYLSWYREHKLADDFYWFVLKAGTPEQPHTLTMEEMRKYGVVTQ